MISIEICIDVPNLAQGVRFYADAFGFSKLSEPYPGVAVLKAGAAAITLLEKREQSKPSPNTREVRHYDRHWTPVHLDFHVEDLTAALDKAVRAGAIKEADLRECRTWIGGLLCRSLRQWILSLGEQSEIMLVSPAIAIGMGSPAYNRRLGW